MGPNVLTTRSFQVVLTEMGLPIHPALLRAHSPKVTPSVVVTVLLFSAWPRGQAVHAGSQRHQRLLSGAAGPLRSRTSWQQKQHLYSHYISLWDSHTRALLQSPKGTCCLSRKSCCTVSVTAVFARFETAWDILACAAVVTEHYIRIIKRSLHCLGWSTKEL